jgi:hypothetical protein
MLITCTCNFAWLLLQQLESWRRGWFGHSSNCSLGYCDLPLSQSLSVLPFKSWRQLSGDWNEHQYKHSQHRHSRIGQLNLQHQLHQLQRWNTEWVQTCNDSELTSSDGSVVGLRVPRSIAAKYVCWEESEANISTIPHYDVKKINQFDLSKEDSQGEYINLLPV